MRYGTQTVGSPSLCDVLPTKNPAASPLQVLLQQRQADQLELQEHWPTTLVSMIQYRSRTQEAVRVAAILSGAEPSPAELQWLPPAICPAPSAEDEEDSVELGEVDIFEEPPQAEQALLNDVLESAEYEDEEDSHGRTLTVKLLWDPPAVSVPLFAGCH